MGNTRKPRNPKFQRRLVDVKLPENEKEVLKEVPAKIGEEVVGRGIIYTDGTTDVILNDDISDIARAKMGKVVAAFNEETGAAFTVGEITNKDL